MSLSFLSPPVVLFWMMVFATCFLFFVALFQLWSRMLTALDSELIPQNIKFPSSPSEFDTQSDLFSRGGRNQLCGCVLAVDGTALRSCRPQVPQAPNLSSYWTREGFFAVNVQAAVGEDYKVQFLCTVNAGSCHDRTAFMSSGLAALLAAAGGLLPEYWAAGDDAYIAGSLLLTPSPGHNLPREKDSLNDYHSSSRTFVKQVIGQIVGRWRVLWWPIRFPGSCAALNVRVCSRLHNFLVNRSSPRPDESP